MGDDHWPYIPQRGDVNLRFLGHLSMLEMGGFTVSIGLIYSRVSQIIG